MSIFTITNNSEANTAEEITRFYEYAIQAAGVVDLDNNDLLITENSPAALSVLVTKGGGAILNSAWTQNDGSQKYYPFVSTAAETVSINSNNSGNPRITSIFAKYDSSANPTTRGEGRITFVAIDGTPAGVPVAPSAPADSNSYLRLANVEVADSATTISNSDITDVRTQSKLNNFIFDEPVLGNDKSLQGQNSTGTAKDLIKLDSSDNVEVGSSGDTLIKAGVTNVAKLQLMIQNDDSGTISNDITPDSNIKVGWGEFAGNGTDTVSITVTFDSAFTQTPIVMSSLLGAVAKGSPVTNQSEFSGPLTTSPVNISVYDITTTSFIFELYRGAGAWSSSVRYGFSWIAIES